MNATSHHKFYGISQSEWINRVPNELEVDAVGFFQLISGGVNGFDLTGGELDEFVRRCIISLLNSGAKVVVPLYGGTWERLAGYDGDPDFVADYLVSSWRAGEIKADHDGIWFSRQYAPQT